MVLQSKHAPISAKKDDLTRTQSLLERYSRDLMDAHSLPDPNAYDIIRKYCTADFTMENASLHECVVPFASSLDQHLRNLDAIKGSNPDWRVNVSNVVAIYDQYTREITVWYTSGASGGSDSEWSTNRESVGILHWRKATAKNSDADPDWECYKHSAIRGGANLDSIV